MQFYNLYFFQTTVIGIIRYGMKWEDKKIFIEK